MGFNVPAGASPLSLPPRGGPSTETGRHRLYGHWLSFLLCRLSCLLVVVACGWEEETKNLNEKNENYEGNEIEPFVSEYCFSNESRWRNSNVRLPLVDGASIDRTSDTKTCLVRSLFGRAGAQSLVSFSRSWCEAAAFSFQRLDHSRKERWLRPDRRLTQQTERERNPNVGICETDRKSVVI